MASNIKGITIQIDAETKGLDKALADVNKRARDAQTELKQVDRLLKLDPKNTELVAQKQQVLAKQVAATREKLDQLKVAQKQVADQFARGDIGEEQYRAFQREIVKTEKELQRLEDVGKKTASQIAASMKGVGDSMKSAGGDLTRNVTLPIVAVGTAATIMAGNFEQSMNLVQAASGASAKEMAKLNELAMRLGAETVFSAKEAADAMLELTKSGITPAQIQAGALDATLRLAAAGDLQLADAAQIAANAMNMFGLSAEDAGTIADALAGGANRSSASVDTLRQALSQVGPGARNAGLTLQQTVAALAMFADKGIQGSDAGTSLKTMLQRLIPTSDEAAAAMERYGLSFVDASGNFDDLSVIAEKLQTKLGSLTEAQKAEALQMIFGSDATRAATVLMQGGAEAVTDYTAAVSESGAAQKMADARMKGFNGSVEQLKGSLETAAITLGNDLLPVIKKIAEAVRKAADSFGKLSPSVRQTIIVVGAIAAAVGPVLVVFGSLINAISVIVTALGAGGVLAGVIPAIAAAFTALTGPIGLVVLALVGVMTFAKLAASAVGEGTPTYDGLASAADRAKDASKRLEQAQKDMKTALDDAKTSVEDLKTAQLDAAQAELNLARAKDGLADAQERVSDLEKAGKKGSEEYRDALLDQQQAEIDLARAVGDKEQAQIDAKKANDQAILDSFAIRAAAHDEEDAKRALASADAEVVRQARIAAGAYLNQKQNYLDFIPAVGGLKDKVLEYKDAQAKATEAIRLYGENSPQAQAAMIQLSVKTNNLRDAAEQAAGKVDGIGDSVNNLPTSRTVDLSVKITGMSELDRLNRDLQYIESHPGMSVNLLALLKAAGKVPSFAKGGIVTRPTLALIGDNPGGREAVVPLNGSGTASMLGGVTIPIQMTNYISKEVDADAVSRRLVVGIEREMRAKGLTA